MTHLFEVTKVRSVCAYDYKFYRCDLILWREWQKLSSRKGPPCLCSNFGYKALHMTKVLFARSPTLPSTLYNFPTTTYVECFVGRICKTTYISYFETLDVVVLLFVLLLYYHRWFTNNTLQVRLDSHLLWISFLRWINCVFYIWC